MTGLPEPLVIAEAPGSSSPGPKGEVMRLLALLRDHHERAESAANLLAEVRFEVYQHASTSFGDPWWMARVAEVEEWTAAEAVALGDFDAAWHAWRAGWWVRRLLEPHDGERLWQHSDLVMHRLRELTGRTN